MNPCAWLFGTTLLLALGGAACGQNPVEGNISGGDETGEAPSISCQPGSVAPCDCNGRPGLQECLDSGAEFSACRCDGQASTTGSTTMDVDSSDTSGEATSGMALTESDGATEDGSTTEDTGGSEGTGTTDSSSTSTGE